MKKTAAEKQVSAVINSLASERGKILKEYSQYIVNKDIAEKRGKRGHTEKTKKVDFLANTKTGLQGTELEAYKAAVARYGAINASIDAMEGIGLELCSLIKKHAPRQAPKKKASVKGKEAAKPKVETISPGFGQHAASA